MNYFGRTQPSEEDSSDNSSDTSEIEAAVDQVIAGNPDQAQQFKDGNQKVAGWFVGQVMKATQGKANPQMVNDLLRKKLG